MPTPDEKVKLSPSGGRVLTGAVFLICIGSGIAYAASGQVARALDLAPAYAFVNVAMWSVFWAPNIVIRGSGVTVHNPLRTYLVPWSAVQRTESRWALTLVTSEKKITVWAAPRQRRGVTGIEVRRDTYGLPDYSAEKRFEQQSATSATADVAEALIARHLASWTDEHPDIREAGVVSTSWRRATIVVLLLLLVASVIVLSL